MNTYNASTIRHNVYPRVPAKLSSPGGSLMPAAGEPGDAHSWVAYNPIQFVLPLLPFCSADARLLLALTICPDFISLWEKWLAAGHSVPAIIGGAVLGALHGSQIFPAAWQEAAQPHVTPMLPIIQVAEQRLQQEREIITVLDTLAEKTPTGESLLEDKIYGCLLASAIGNAMGSPVECMLYPEIEAKYPGGVLTVLLPERLESEDDNQMAMLLLETYLARQGRPVMARHFGNTWKERLPAATTTLPSVWVMPMI